jgi:transcriptional regulator with XRE-family HTH domain
MTYQFSPERLRAARKAAGYTQERLARQLDSITLRTVQRWEIEPGGGPKGGDLLALADILGIAPEALYEAENDDDERTRLEAVA